MAELGETQLTARMPHLLFHRLAVLIAEGAYAPGAVIRDKAIATELGMSRTPAREAILRLQRAGLVQVAPSRGTTITFVTAESARHSSEFAAVHVGDIIRLAMPSLRSDARVHVQQLAADAATATRAQTAWVGPHIQLLEFLSDHANNPFYRTLFGDFWYLALRDLAHFGQSHQIADDVRSLGEAIYRGEERTAIRAVHHMYSQGQMVAL